VPLFLRLIALQALVSALCLIGLSQPAIAQSPFCGINRVIIEKEAVRVFFLRSVTLEGSSLSPGQFEIENGIIRWPFGKTETGLLLSRGQKVFLVDRRDLRDRSARPTVICSIEFAEADGQTGIRAQPFSPGSPPPPGTQQASKFISAEVDQGNGP